MNQITVLLAEDHTIVREGLRNMLKLENDLEVVGEAQDGRQAVTLTRKLRPSVVLMDTQGAPDHQSDHALGAQR